MKKSIPHILVLVFLTSCTAPTKKEKLAAQLIDMRTIPTNLVEVTQIGHYDIAYQDKNTYSERYYYPNNYAMGKINASKNDYDYVTQVIGISPINEFEYVSTILERFATDSTHIQIIIKEDDQIKANVYRKAMHPKSIYLMWKWIKAPYGTVNFETIQSMNEKWFNLP